MLLKKSAHKIGEQLERNFYSLKWSAKIVLKKERIITSFTILLIIHRRTVPLIIIWLTERISSTPYGFQGVRQWPIHSHLPYARALSLHFSPPVSGSLAWTCFDLVIHDWIWTLEAEGVLGGRPGLAVVGVVGYPIGYPISRRIGVGHGGQDGRVIGILQIVL